MISAIRSQGSVRFMVYQETMNQQRLIRFMERLIRTSQQKVFLILDNLKVHHGNIKFFLCFNQQPNCRQPDKKPNFYHKGLEVKHIF